MVHHVYDARESPSTRESPPRKRQCGVKHQIVPTAAHFCFRLLCPQELMGSIMGRGGSTVVEMERQFGCKILKQGCRFPGTSMRLVHIMACCPSNVKDCLRDILSKCSGSGEDWYKVNFVIPKTAVSALVSGPVSSITKLLQIHNQCRFEVADEVYGIAVAEQRGYVQGDWEGCYHILLSVFDALNEQRDMDYFYDYAAGVGVRRGPKDEPHYQLVNKEPIPSINSCNFENRDRNWPRPMITHCGDDDIPRGLPRGTPVKPRDIVPYDQQVTNSPLHRHQNNNMPPAGPLLATNDPFFNDWGAAYHTHTPSMSSYDSAYSSSLGGVPLPALETRRIRHGEDGGSTTTCSTSTPAKSSGSLINAGHMNDDRRLHNGWGGTPIGGDKSYLNNDDGDGLPVSSVLPSDFTQEAERLAALSGMIQVTTIITNHDICKVLGGNGERLERLENETYTKIKVQAPMNPSNSRHVAFTGSPLAVNYALMRMFNLIAEDA